MSTGYTVPVDWLTDAIRRIFVAVGVSGKSAQAVAEALVEADLRGIPSHGTLLVPMYVERIRKGSVTTADGGDVVTDRGAVATLDAGHALGVLTADQAMRLAVAKAHAYGLGAVTVRHAFHFGGAFRYAATAARAGCVGIAMANTRPLMPAPGGAEPVVGNNPLAIAVPRTGGEPLLLDMALSEAALGKIRLAEAEGRAIPATWATDPAGVPTTDPRQAIAGMLLPSGGPKGYGLAVMVEILTGVLSGGAFSGQVRGLYADTARPNDCAHFFLAIHPEAFGGTAHFAQRVQDLALTITASKPAPDIDRVYLPGEMETLRRQSAAGTGVRLDASVLDSVRATAVTAGVVLTDPT
ncbi:Ldh family oxidoreductase [Streptomyces shenzhenensis]|uniref:Ldh family oxidoreductase n=1 Tax=Streptomyces shenzhenensis TaxID=943815 RepID=UPI0038172D8A